MALVVRQSVNLSGESMINDQTIASFNAQIPQSSGGTNVNINIVNQQLYDDNRNQVRADEAEFQAKVYEIEDGIYNGVHE